MKTIDFEKYLENKMSDPKFKKGFNKEYQKLKKKEESFMGDIICKELVLDNIDCVVIYNKNTDKLMINAVDGEELFKINVNSYDEKAIREKLGLRPDIKIYKPLTKEEILKLDKSYYLVNDDGDFCSMKNFLLQKLILLILVQDFVKVKI